MGSTKAIEHFLIDPVTGETIKGKETINGYVSDADENSGVSARIYTNTGTNKRKNGLPVFSDTYTTSYQAFEFGTLGRATDLNVQLLSWYDPVNLPAGSIHSSLDSKYSYSIYGHPDKFVYDYSQEYSNCGVDSALNILAMAGVKDVIENGATYKEYKQEEAEKAANKEHLVWNESTGSWEVQTKENAASYTSKLVWDETTSSWVVQKTEISSSTDSSDSTDSTGTTVLPETNLVETEDEFLLWAVQNSKNDGDWYYGTYTGDIPNIKNTEDTDYTVHAKDYDEYKTIDDLKAAKDEVGGTTVVHRDNILNYYGVESEILDIEVEYIHEVVEKEVVSQTWEDVIYVGGIAVSGTLTEVVVTRDKYGKEITTTTTIAQKVRIPNEDGTYSVDVTAVNPWDGMVDIYTHVTSVVEHVTDTDYYNFLTNSGEVDAEGNPLPSGLCDLIDEGKGVILAGYGYALKGESGGAHAISLVGYVYSDAQLHTETTVTINGEQQGDPEYTYRPDIVGVYIVDTGGFAEGSGSDVEQAQFITCEQLYDFLTNKYYPESPGSMTTYVNATVNEIRSWADELNIVGNDRKNVLIGNQGDNVIHGNKGNDVLQGAAGNDTIYGGDDEDIIYGNAGNDILVGGKGDDRYIFNASTDFTEGVDGCHDYIILGSGKDSIQFDSYSSINTDPGYSYSMDFNGNIYQESSYKSYLTDIHDMRYVNKDGDLVIYYTITSEKTTENYEWAHEDPEDKYSDWEKVNTQTTTEIGYNNNTLTVQDYFSKGLYNNLVNIIQTTDQKAVDDPTYGKDDVFNFQKEILAKGYVEYEVEAEKDNNIKGTKFNDKIIGGNKNDKIEGGAGNDYLDGGSGDDTIKAGSGNDIIYASSGNDNIYMESGNNIVKYQGNYGGNDILYSGKGTDSIELLDCTRDDIILTKANKDLVVTYNKDNGSSITISNYFGKKGNLSFKNIILDSDVIDLKGSKNYNNILVEVAKNPGNNGNDTFKGTNGDDLLNGGLGDDTLKGGKGNDQIIGGLGNDKLYGEAGENTYIFETKADGRDIIYTANNTKSVIKFNNGTGVNFDKEGVIGGYNDYSFTKSKNNLVINYATNEADNSNAQITVSNFFKAKGDFTLVSADGSTLDLKTATIYMNGSTTKKNNITGSDYNDLIIGYDHNDTLKGGKGDDTIIGGKGNDTITGGAGTNIINYTKGDGFDTINLTKGENLDIKLDGFDIDATEGATKKIFDYELVKKDLVISYVDEKGVKQNILKIKNYGSKDVTTATGSVELYNNGTLVKDLRNDIYLDAYEGFTVKKYKYTGKWQAEVIDARALNECDDVPPKDRGAYIKAQGGDDIIYGSDYNDTIYGGEGNDTIYSGYGVNTLDGNNGNDSYYIFEGRATVAENTTIKDTGKNDNDRLYICTESLADLQTQKNAYNSNQGSIWFNISANGQYSTTFNIQDANGKTATVSGVEQIYVSDKDGNVTHKYNYGALISDVTNWLNAKGYGDVNQVMNEQDSKDVNDILATYFTNDSYFVAV